MTKFSTRQPFRHHVGPKRGDDGGDEEEDEEMSDEEKEKAAKKERKERKATTAKPEAKKKPAIACLFCRERKICCGPPTADDTDPRCK